MLCLHLLRIFLFGEAESLFQMSFTNMNLNTLSLRTLLAIYVCMYVLPNEPMLQLSVMEIPLEQIQSKIEDLSINNSWIVS